MRSIMTYTAVLLSFMNAEHLMSQNMDSLRVWTLEECIEYALEHNVEFKSESLVSEESEISLSDSRWAFAPRLSVSSGYNVSIGRVLDETTYDFITNEIMGSSSSSISGSVVLFDGLKNLRQLQYSRISRESARLQIEKAADDLELNVIACYLEVLCARENIRNCESVVESLTLQEEHVSRKVEVGKVTLSDLLQIQSKLAEAENTLLTALHAYDLSRLNLCQLLEIDDYESFAPQDDTADTVEYMLNDYNALIDNADHLPEIGIVESVVAMSEKSLQLARSSYYPSLSLSAGYGSSYSSVRRKIGQGPDGATTYNPYPFIEQYGDNASGYISLGISIPILNGMSARNSVRRAKVDLKRSEYALDSAKKQIRRNLTQLMLDTETAWKKYSASLKFLDSANEALRQVGLKYNAGAADVVEYNSAVSNQTEAMSQCLVTKYEYVFKIKVVEFYEQP